MSCVNVESRGEAKIDNSAGVIGLDVALLLAEQGLGSYITVIAEHFPGDTSINYTSPWYVQLNSALHSVYHC